MGFEPTNGGFADLSLGPLGYRAKPLIIANLFEAPGTPTRSFGGKNAYFFSAIAGTFASLKNRADSSGGVGLM